MDKTKTKEFLKAINQELKKAHQMAKERKKAAKEFAGASRSQQGDRLYFEDANHMAQGYLSRLKALKKELVTAEKRAKKPKIVKSVSYVTVEYQDNHKSSFYFVTAKATLPGTQLVSSKSPLGRSIQGKKEGEKFSYQIERDNESISFSGQVTKIE